MNSTLFPKIQISPLGLARHQILSPFSLSSTPASRFHSSQFSGKWIIHSLKNRGPTTDKTREWQRELNGLKRRHFHFAIEKSLSDALAHLPWLGYSHSQFLISHTVTGFALAFMLFGVASYAFFTLTASLSDSYPSSSSTGVLTGYIAQQNHPHHSLQSLLMPLDGVLLPGRAPRFFHSEVCE